MKKENLIKIVNNFREKKIGVLGDLMLDEFIFGDIDRISPESSAPVVLVKKESFNLGGAGNVAANIVDLGGNADIAGLAGKDTFAEAIIKEFKKRKIVTSGIIKNKEKITIRKTRIVAGGKYMIRVDRENCDDIGSDLEKRFEDFIALKIKKWDSFVISDYAKGLVTENLSKKIITLALKYKKPIICDTKPKHFNYFKNVTVLTPNQKEACRMAKTSDFKKAGKILQEQLNSNILITQGSDGVTLFTDNSKKHFPAQTRAVLDATGAGDTIVAGLALSLASGADLQEACFLANLAAGIVVGKSGVATVTGQELILALKSISI